MKLLSSVPTAIAGLIRHQVNHVIKKTCKSKIETAELYNTIATLKLENERLLEQERSVKESAPSLNLILHITRTRGKKTFIKRCWKNFSGEPIKL